MPDSPVVTLPMFPLGSSLLPGMPLALRVFEPRYLELLARVLPDDEPAFGVVLIERGQEVGGGDQRFAHGVVARISEVVAEEQAIGLLAVGGERFDVIEWLDDEPYPTARVRVVDEPSWDADLQPLLDETEREVRLALADPGPFAERIWPPETALDDDPVARCWQLAGIAPVAELDRIRFLRADTLEELLRRVLDETRSSQAGWAAD